MRGTWRAVGVGVALMGIHPWVVDVEATAKPAAGVQIGTYECTGTRGVVQYAVPLIVEAHGKAYRLQWGTPPQIQIIGLGIAQHGVLAVALVSSGGGVGVAHYLISPGWLEGVWTRGDGSLDTERCRLGRPA